MQKHDSLTGLLSLDFFMDELDAAVALRAPVALVLAEVDDFKAITGFHGEEIGEAVIRAVAAAMDKPQAVVARGQDSEFVALLIGVDRDTAEQYCWQVNAELAERTIIDFRLRIRVKPVLNIGLAGDRDGGKSVLELLRGAHMDLKQAREIWRWRQAG